MLFSYGRLKKFEDCPRAWYLKYVLEREEPTTEAQVTGKMVHKALELLIKGADPDKALLQAIITKASLAVDFKEAARQFESGAKYLQGLVNSGSNRANWQVERHFQLPLDPGDPFSPEIQGYIDFIDNNQSILDWKTGHKIYNPLDNHQLGLYAWAVSQQSGRDANAALYFLRSGTVKSQYYTAPEMEAARSWALNLALEIEQKLLSMELGDEPQELFPAGGGAVCKYCGFARECGDNTNAADQPADGAELTVPGIPQTPQEAENLAANIMRTEAVVKAMKEDLKKWVEAQGPVLVDDQKWDFWPSVTWEFTPDQKKAAALSLTNAGKNPWEYLGFGAAQINKIKKDLGWTDEVLASLGGKQKTTKSFKSLGIKTQEKSA